MASLIIFLTGPRPDLKPSSRCSSFQPPTLVQLHWITRRKKFTTYHNKSGFCTIPKADGTCDVSSYIYKYISILRYLVFPSSICKLWIHVLLLETSIPENGFFINFGFCMDSIAPQREKVYPYILAPPQQVWKRC